MLHYERAAVFNILFSVKICMKSCFHGWIQVLTSNLKNCENLVSIVMEQIKTNNSTLGTITQYVFWQ